jgi:hypothetical protein
VQFVPQSPTVRTVRAICKQFDRLPNNFTRFSILETERICFAFHSLLAKEAIFEPVWNTRRPSLYSHAPEPPRQPRRFFHRQSIHIRPERNHFAPGCPPFSRPITPVRATFVCTSRPLFYSSAAPRLRLRLGAQKCRSPTFRAILLHNKHLRGVNAPTFRCLCRRLQTYLWNRN